MKKFFLVVLFLFAAGCSSDKINSIHTINISTEPKGAKLFVNKKYVGLTPQSIALQCWTHNSGTTGGDVVMCQVRKEGYKIFKKTISCSDLAGKWLSGLFEESSKYGSGQTYYYIFTLRRKEL